MKAKRWIAMALLSCCIAVPTACTEEPVSSQQLLHGFESVKELLTVYRVNVDNTQLCTETEFVSEGKASMKVATKQEVAADEYASDIVLAFTPTNRYFNESIFLGKGYFSVDIYNPNQTEYEVCVDIGNQTTDIYTLAAGWNTVITNNFVLGQPISHYELTFRSQQGKSAEFFVDNLQYCTEDRDAEAYQFDNKKTVWLDFSNEVEKTYFEPIGKPLSAFSAPRFTVETNENYSLANDGSLKVAFHYTNGGKIDITTFKTRDTKILEDFNIYVGEENWYFFFDIYNAYNYDIYVDVSITQRNGAIFGKRLKLFAKQWSDSENARIYINEMKDSLLGGEMDAVSVTYSFSGIKTEGCVYIDSVGIKK